MIGIDNCRLPFVRCERCYLVNLAETTNAKNTVSPYFGAKDFAFALA